MKNPAVVWSALGLGMLAGAAYLLMRKPEVKQVPAGAPKALPPQPVVIQPVFKPDGEISMMRMPVETIPPLDVSLATNEKEAVIYALTREGNPQNLRAFAGSMLRTAPIAASLLMNRASQLGG